MSLPDKAMKLKDGKILYDNLRSMVAVNFDQATANEAGSYVCYQGAVYHLPDGHTAGTTWANTTKVGPTNIGGEVSTLKSAITPLTPSASASDVGKVLKAKTVADGKVSEYEFGSLPSVPVTDVQVNGSSVLNNGVANVPRATSSVIGVVKAVSTNGIKLSYGDLIIDKATSNAVKEGTNNYNPVVPYNQHESTFYGLAKAAGDTTQASSSNPVGQFTDDALVKIQKMLGIYEAPWELIREDTFTNDTEANHFITVDGNGNTFELSELVLLMETPQQDTLAKKSTATNVFRYNGNLSVCGYTGNWTQNSGEYSHGAFVVIENDHNMIKVRGRQPSVRWGGASEYMYYDQNFSGADQAVFYQENMRIYEIELRGILGKFHYKLYGRRAY